MDYGDGMRLAALPWYDFPAVADRTDALWNGLRRHLLDVGLDAPAALDRTLGPYAILREPSLLVSQICGYVSGGVARGLVRSVVTPDYDLGAAGCVPARPGRPGDYFSVVVARREHACQPLEGFRGARCAANDPLSHSGVNALREIVLPLARDGRFFSAVEYTGGHVQSMQRVAAGDADLACIDAVTFALARRFAPQVVEPLALIGTTAPAPAPPLVTAAAVSDKTVRRLRRAINRWLDDPASDLVRRELLWVGAIPSDDLAYRVMAHGRDEAMSRGLVDLCEVEEEMPGDGTGCGGFDPLG